MTTPTNQSQDMMMISFIIKTYNEEKHIAACIESVLAATSDLPNPCEIIVADSLSADRTIQIAASYPVKIVQFKNPEERGCGAGVQLGYQNSRGDLVFLLDGDMTLCTGFLPIALETLSQHDHLGGVAGLMKEVAIRNTFDELRVSSGASSTARDEPWLNGGGLYRRKAIDSAGGYAANRNLKGWEEAELGMRLQTAGWKLRRIPVPGVQHDGHSADTKDLLLRHWRNKRLMSNGVLLRSSFAKPWCLKAAQLLIHPLAVVCSWLVVLAIFFSPHWAYRDVLVQILATIAALTFLVLVLKKRSLRRGLQTVIIWHIHAAALLHGLFFPGSPPLAPISCVVVCNGPSLTRCAKR